MRKFGKYLADKSVSGIKNTSKKMVTDTDKKIGNLWTGKKASGLATVSAFGIAGAYTASKASGDGLTRETKHQSLQGTYVGAAPIMNADGVGSTTNAPTLGANGDMVFGLHNSRRG